MGWTRRGAYRARGCSAARPAVPAVGDRIDADGVGSAPARRGDAMMLWQIGRRRRSRGESAPGPLETRLEQTASSDSLALIDAAMRHLRAVTVDQNRPKPAVLAVRVGAYGFEVLLEQPTPAPPGWRSASGGHVLELPPGTTVHDLGAVMVGASLCPTLVPVGTTYEGPLMLNLEQIGSVAVSGPNDAAAELVAAVVPAARTALRRSGGRRHRQLTHGRRGERHRGGPERSVWPDRMGTGGALQL